MFSWIRGLSSTVTLGAGAVAGAVFVFTILRTWDALVDDPAVRREALIGYVKTAEFEAVKAKAEEAARQRDAAVRAAKSYADILADVRGQEATAREALEQRISDYEQELSRVGRVCRLDGRDIEWLRAP